MPNIIVLSVLYFEILATFFVLVWEIDDDKLYYNVIQVPNRAKKMYVEKQLFCRSMNLSSITLEIKYCSSTKKTSQLLFIRRIWTLTWCSVMQTCGRLDNIGKTNLKIISSFLRCQNNLDIYFTLSTNVQIKNKH